MTVGSALRWARQAIGGDSGAVDAEILLGWITGKSCAALIALDGEQLSAAQAEKFQHAVSKRINGEPIAYLIAQKEFWSLPFRVTRDVLIPRTETELLVERVLVHSAHGTVHTILDLGTGSGVIALALAVELPDCHIVAADISAPAIEVARHNFHHLKAEWKMASVNFYQSDWFAALGALCFDVIVANPPYVAPHDPHLKQGDLRFEPRTAVLAQQNGLADLTWIIGLAGGYLSAGGVLIVEHGYLQAEAVQKTFLRNGFTAINTHFDLGGNERVTQGEWPGCDKK